MQRKPNLKRKRVPHWPIAVPIIRELRERREEKGVSVSKSLEDAVRYALKNRGEWW